MKKLISFVMALMLCMSLFGSALAVDQISHDGHDHGEAICVVEVPVTAEMLLLAEKQGFIHSENTMPENAACTHPSYSAWTTIDAWYQLSPVFGNCYVLVEVQIRYCSICGAAFGRQTSTQLSHIIKGTSNNWYCQRCGLSGGTVTP